MKTSLGYIFSIVFILIGCASPTESREREEENTKNEKPLKPVELTAHEIVAESYSYHGCEKINSASIVFDFREFHLRYLHTDTGLVRSREFLDSSNDTIKDVWSRNRLIRYRNGDRVKITEEKAKAYKNSVNSVFYFAYLPKSLRDPAVNLTYLDTSSIGGEQYHKIKVTFDVEGGGEDHEDVFVYWFDIEDYSMDYLAYSYETNGGGMRFRSFQNRRKIDGVVFQDYLNFAPPEGSELIDLDAMFNKGKLKQVSVIELKNVEVKD